MDERLKEAYRGYRERLEAIASAKDPYVEYGRLLKKASWHYSKGFKEQVMILAQAPEARAVLSGRDWGRLYGRGIKPQAEGIVVEDARRPGTASILYGIRDTLKEGGSREVRLWSGGRPYDQASRE